MLAAIILLGSEGLTEDSVEGILGGVPPAGIDLLGESIVARTAQSLHLTGFNSIAIFATANCPTPLALPFSTRFDRSADPRHAALKALEESAGAGAQTVLFLRLGAYIEFDPLHLVQFHLEQQEPATRAFDTDGLLDLWVIDASRIHDIIQDTNGLERMPASAGDCALCAINGYVNRLSHPRALRNLVSDSFAKRCHLRPTAHEVRPGVWLAAGAQVDRKARLVAPVFIGTNSKIQEDCLVARGSAIERDCQIDCGTTVESSLVLPNSYVGIGLDVSHSIVGGCKLMNLERNLLLDISDPGVIRNIGLRPASVEAKPYFFDRFGWLNFLAA